MLAFLILRRALIVAGLLPLARLVVLGLSVPADGVGSGLGANPLEFVTRSTGTWALVFLCLSLSITPLRRWSDEARWMPLRRPLGLYAFFYAALHFALWLWVENAFDVLAMAKDALRRPFIAAGLIAFLPMIPLALTSTRRAMRRLGRHWSRLHRLVYLAALAAIVHYAWHKAGKNDFSQVLIYAVLLAVLLGVRLNWCLRRKIPGN